MAVSFERSGAATQETCLTSTESKLYALASRESVRTPDYLIFATSSHLTKGAKSFHARNKS